jgi:hypothetical protein
MLFAAPTQAQAAGSIPVPNWLVKSVLTSRGEAIARQTFIGEGYTCLPLGLVCYINGNYDPPRWGHGTVDTGGPGTYVNARAWASPSAPMVRTFPDRWKLTIFCQTTGDTVNGRWGPTNVWDFVGKEGERGRFVSDGFVYTGSNGFVAGDCAATNYGG